MKKLIAKTSYVFVQTRIKQRFKKIKNFFKNTSSKAERHQKIIRNWIEYENGSKPLKEDVKNQFFIFSLLRNLKIQNRILFNSR